MRFLHTSDWHLGRIFHGVHLTEDQAYILEQFIKLVGDTRPDAILISGDIYDRSVPPHEAVKLLDEVLSHILMDYQVPIISVAGNHDSPERLEFGRRLLSRQGLHIVGQLSSDPIPVVIRDEYGPVYFCPIPYVEPAMVRERLRAHDIHSHDQAMACLVQQLMSRIPQGTRTVALAHAFVAGSEECESERPLSVGGTDTVSSTCFQHFNYVALGHLHKSQSAGEVNIRYAGSLMKYSFSEVTHKKSVLMVEMNDLGETKYEEISLCPRRDVRYLEGFLNDILLGPQNGEGKGDYLMVSLKDTGAILDAIGKLREVYPNILHIERPHLTHGGELRGPGGDHRRLSEVDLFTSFYEQVTGLQVSREQENLFAKTVELVYQQEREE